PDPPVPQVDVATAQGDCLGGSRPRPESEVDERVVLAARVPEPLEDALALLVRVGIDLGSVRTLADACHEATIEELPQVPYAIARELRVAEHPPERAVRDPVDGA